MRTVAGTGTGIAPAALPRIFHPFSTTEPDGAGTGLRLSISFGIVREHGGSIQAQFQPGRRAIFTVIPPIRDPDAAARAD